MQIHAAPTCDVTVVLPTYNGGDRLRPCVDSVVDALDVTSLSFEVIVVVDGSTDGSDDTLGGLPGEVKVIRHRVNSGKGAALRTGFGEASGEYVGFIDSDGDISPGVIGELCSALAAEPSAWAALGSKNVAGASVGASFGRRAMSFGFRAVVRVLFGLEATDTQCGAKMFRRGALAAALPHTAEEGFVFDLELLAVGSRLGLGSTVDRPVTLRREGTSTMSALTGLTMLWQSVLLRRRIRQRLRRASQPSGLA